MDLASKIFMNIQNKLIGTATYHTIRSNEVLFFTEKILLLLFSCLSLSLLNAQVLQKVDSLELTLKFTKTPRDKIETLLNISNELKNNDPAKALEYATKANKFSEEIKDDKAILNSMLRMADIYWMLADYKTAMKIGIESKELAEELGLVKELALSLHVIGLIYYELDDYDKSAEYFFEGLKLCEQIKDKKGIGGTYSSIGVLYFKQKKYDKALEYYFKSMNIAKEMNYHNVIAGLLNNIAAVYGSRGDYRKASQYIEESLKITKELGNKQLEGINYLNLGEANSDMKNFDKAIEYYKNALSIFENLQNKIFIARCQINIGHYFLDINEIERSIEYTTKAFKTGEKHGLKTIIHNSSELLGKIYYSKNDTLNAFKYDIIKYRMKDSLNLENSILKISKLELQYEFNKKEQEKRVEQQRKDFINTIIIISLVFSIVMVTLILLARQRIKAKNALFVKKQLKNEIEYKNKELAINVMSLIKKNEMLSGISDKLVFVESEAVKEETKDALKKIARELKKSAESEIWKEFGLRFKQVHIDFYSKLLEKFPELSSGEQKLCAFLRLNMSTKEISDLTGQSVSAIEVARHRLRKKLGISNTKVNLVSFLIQV